ncbi:MAG: efflux RND transporter periplasmic adaptor subunit, partial [Massilia sp.]|nr:efflux RND transporter periplasmic adaptor subunit [Massilia sp.]
ALRFRLSDEEAEKEKKNKKASASASAAVPAPQDDDDLAFRSKSETTRMFKVYKLDDKNQAVPVDIKIGLSNFRFTEVLAGELKKGDKVITRYLASGAKPE